MSAEGRSDPPPPPPPPPPRPFHLSTAPRFTRPSLFGVPVFNAVSGVSGFSLRKHTFQDELPAYGHGVGLPEGFGDRPDSLDGRDLWSIASAVQHETGCCPQSSPRRASEDVAFKRTGRKASKADGPGPSPGLWYQGRGALGERLFRNLYVYCTSALSSRLPRDDQSSDATT